MLSLESVRQRSPPTESTSTESAFDTVPQPPSATFRFAPHLLLGCNHSLFHDKQARIGVLPWARGLQRSFGLLNYCRTGQHRGGGLPPAPAPAVTLDVSEVLFAIMTSGPLLATRARHLERVLYQQGARHVELFAEIEAENTTRLPEAARLQELLQCNTRRGGCQGGVLHVAQKHLELLWTLGSRARRPHLPRWVVVADDDTFLWVNRWVKALANFNDTRPLFVGGGGARTHMCGPRLCDKARYVSQWRFIPQVNTHGGGMGYALTMAALRRMRHALARGACLDTSFGDAATGFCAAVAGVQQVLLPGAMINSNAADLMRAASHHRVKMNVSYYRDRLLPIRGELLSYHKLLQQSGNETMLCWATHGECDKRCRSRSIPY